MEQKQIDEIINDIDYEIRKNMTNGICLSGGNISILKQHIEKKYISKKKMRNLLEEQMKYLQRIQNSKNEILKKLKTIQP